VRCEKCTAENHYFDESQARCLDCGDIAAKVTVAAGTLSILLRAAVAVRVVIHRHQGSAARTLLHWLQSAQRVWQVAGMRYKVKRLVGFYQCISAVPSVFNVVTPTGLDEYARWINVFEVTFDLEYIVVPPSCLGDFRLPLSRVVRLALAHCAPHHRRRGLHELGVLHPKVAPDKRAWSSLRSSAPRCRSARGAATHPAAWAWSYVPCCTQHLRGDLQDVPVRADRVL
jgi:hypothetical protein